MKTKRAIINVICPILVGTFIYYLFCPDIYFVKYIDQHLGWNYHITCSVENIFLSLVRYYLLDFLWAYSFMSCCLIMIGKSKTAIACIFAFQGIIELLQIFPEISGTFDIFDILVEYIANIIVIFQWRENKNEKN